MHREDPRLEAQIILSYKNSREAEAVAKAVSPDNVKTPSGLTVKTTRRGQKVLTLVKCERRLETFIATLDDLLMAVQVAERAVSASRPS